MKRIWSTVGVVAAGALVLAGCSGGESADAPSETADSTDAKVVNVLAYDSLELSDELLARFEEETGFTAEVTQLPSGGELVNQLVLTKDNPLGDMVFGVDNITAYRAIQADVFSSERPEVDETLLDQGIPEAPGLVPFDQGDVCVNIDHEWFENNDREEPQTFDDLTQPENKDLLVAMNPTSSSPGMAFLVATISNFGDDWEQYWRDLKDNGVKITKGWSDAFNVDYSAGEGEGERPLMVSYSSSPAYSVNDEGTASSTGALLDTCFHQIEYMGVLNGAANVDGAKAFMEFMLEVPQQEEISAANYMHPINPDAQAPEALINFGPMADRPHQMDPQTIEEKQQEWLTTWSEIMGQ
ncbi:MAG: thiamine ABC transporter substrate-binding protein [Actinomycetaceae bacterium]|nr:thiamine ABC transporter substrate-binding protein [Actinomycetaceae bacterium]